MLRPSSSVEASPWNPAIHAKDVVDSASVPLSVATPMLNETTKTKMDMCTFQSFEQQPQATKLSTNVHQLRRVSSRRYAWRHTHAPSCSFQVVRRLHRGFTRHVVCPVRGCQRPGVHAAQRPAPACALAVFALQLVHVASWALVAPVVPDVPAGHGPRAAIATMQVELPLVFTNVPDAHGMHAPCPMPD